MRSCNFRAEALDEAMFPYVTLAKDKEWQPGPYEGVELLVLHKNEATGGVTILRKFREGLMVPAHTHPLANEYAYVLSGEWRERRDLHHGRVFFASKGVKHVHHAKTEVISLTVFDGPLTLRSVLGGRTGMHREDKIPLTSSPVLVRMVVRMWTNWFRSQCT